MTLKAGIIGAGRIGWSYDGGRWDGQRSVSHAACFDRHPRTELIGVFDPIPQAQAAFCDGYQGAQDVTVTGDLDRFLALGLDVVAIASPSTLHPAHLLACTKAQIPYIWLEKPATLSLADHDALLEALGQHNQTSKVSVNYFRRALPQVAEIKRRIAQGFVVTDCSVTYSRGLAVNGVHLLDLVGALFPHTPEVLDWIRPGPGLGAPTGASPSFGFSLGDLPVTFTGHDLPYHAIELHLTGPTGRLSLIEGGAQLIWQAAVPNPDYPGFFRLDQPRPCLPTDQTEQAMRDGTYLMLCDLLDGQGPAVSTLDTARFAQVLLELAEGRPA